MTPTHHLPADWTAQRRTLFALVAEPGPRRTEWLRQQLDDAAGAGCRTWFLPCDFAEGGPWAGIRELVRAIVFELSTSRPELLSRHAYELAHVLPTARRHVAVRHESLTDVTFGVERVRNFPADRANRFVHGLVDLLAEVHSEGDGAWVLGCDSLDRSGPIARQFFRELLRRRGDRLGLVLLAGVELENAAQFADEFSTVARCKTLPGQFLADPAPAVDAEKMERQARELEERALADENEGEELIPDLVRSWGAAGNLQRKLYWQMRALELYPRLGFYADALLYSDALSAEIAAEDSSTPEVRWLLFFKTFVSLCSVHRGEEALRLAERELQGEAYRDNPESGAQILYLMAMLHVRFMPKRDLALGEALLEQGMGELERIVDREARTFGQVFNRNGLALIRNFQGRREEAITLCRDGFVRLEAELAADKHRLHRSVLVYNIAQVYAAMGAQEEAFAYYAAAMEMDPFYSEYYNERGNLYLAMGRLDDACTDYRTAIDLSPPYPEVHTNLGQCLRRLGRFAEAVEAYGTALDLSPDILLARLGRAQAYDELGKPREALADYDAALAIEPDSAEVLGNRAVLLFGEGRLRESLADLDRALELAPERHELHENRAFLLAELERLEGAEISPPHAASAASAASAPSRP